MTEKKRREKVVAEITVAHLTQLVQTQGCSLTPDQAVAFLNQGGRAYDMWKHMMRAGEDYIKSTLQNQRYSVSGRPMTSESPRLTM
jgi:hypothetical protein